MTKSTTKILMILALISITIYTYTKQNKHICPSECTETFYINQVDFAYKFEDVETVLQRNILKQDFRFVCFSGLTYYVPGLSLKTNKQIIEKYGAKLICIGDITNEKHSEFVKKLYHYYEKYNQMLLEKLFKK